MKNRFTVSKIVQYSILLIFSVFCVVMLAFSTLYADERASQLYFPDPDSGFKWLTFESNIAWGSHWDAASIPLGIISILQLCFGIVAILLVVYNFLVKQSQTVNRVVITVGLISMLLYAIEGIVFKFVYCDIMDFDFDYFATAAFVPLIIGVLLTIGYFIAGKCLPNVCLYSKTLAETSTTVCLQNEEKKSTLLTSNAIDDVIKLKSLLDQGILSQEEFDEKKKQLLDL